MVVADVFAEHIAAEITVEITPGGMDVISTVLGIGILKQESRSLDSVIMWFKLLGAACPRETNFF